MIWSSAAEIVDDGPWTGYDFEKADFFGNSYYEVRNGIVTYNDPSWVKRVESTRMIPLNEIQNIYTQPNVALVNAIFPESEFERLFPKRFKRFLYEPFLKAVAQFPAFCGEFSAGTGHANLLNQEKACRRELATLFAHVIYESGYARLGNQSTYSSGLSARRDKGCRNADTTSNPPECNFYDTVSQFSTFFPNYGDEQYFGRSAIRLKWNSNYGRLSKAMYPNEFYG